MKVKLPKSRTLKLDLFLILLVTSVFYWKIESIFKYILGDAYDLPLEEVGLSKILLMIVGLILVYSIILTIVIVIARSIVAYLFKVDIGYDFKSFKIFGKTRNDR